MRRVALRALAYAALLAPVVVFGLYAFSSGWFFPSAFPREWTAAEWLNLLSDARFGEAVLNSVLIAAGATALSVAIGAPAARAMGAHRAGRAVRAVRAMFLAPLLLPSISLSIGMNALFLRLGWTGSPGWVALAHLSQVLPYTVYVMLGMFARYDASFEEQARTLGAPPLRVLVEVTLPMLAPGLLSAGLMGFLVSWSQYLLTVLIGGGSVLTLPVYLFAAASGGRAPLIGATALVFATVPAAVMVWVSRTSRPWLDSPLGRHSLGA